MTTWKHPPRPQPRPLLAAWWLIPAILAALVALWIGALTVKAIEKAAYDAAHYEEWKG